MKEKLRALQRKLADKLKESERLLDVTQGDESRALTSDESTKVDAIHAEAREIKQQIKTLSDQIELGDGLDNIDDTRSIIQGDPNDNDAGTKRRAQVIADREAERPFAHFGEQLFAIRDAAMSQGAVIDKRLLEIRAQGASEGIPSDGGYLVQTDFSTELLRNAFETGITASRVRRIPISANSNGMTINAVDETSRADGSRFGGVQAYWLNEGGTATKSKPKFRQMELTLKKLIGLFYATDELLADATALGAVAQQAFAEEFGFKLDDAIVNGDGAGKPLGITQSNAVVSVAKETSQTASTIVYENIVKMYARLWGRSRANSVWLINQDILPQLMTMSLPVGTGGGPVYLPAGGASAAPFQTLFGRPLFEIEQCATLGTVGDIILTDLSQYLMIDKGGTQTATSIHVQFTTDEMVFRFILRVDGQPVWNSALPPFKGSNTLSPIITLATRA